jgi:hypothetical protein
MKLPENILALFPDDEYDYRDLELKQQQCNALGWTFEYGLDGIPYNFKPL